MNAEEFKQELNMMGARYASLTSGWIRLTCPFSDHLGVSNGLSPDLYIGENGSGQCLACGQSASFQSVISALKEKKGAMTVRRDGMPYISSVSDNAGLIATLPGIYSWKEFSAHEFPWANRWRVKGLIPISARCVIAAPSGEGKSWCAMAMAKSVAAGLPYLGNSAFETTQCKVLYIENETAKSDFQRRGKRLGFHEVEDNLFAPLDDWPPLNNKKTAEALFEFVKKQKIEMVFIDTFRSIAGGIKENEADEIRKVFDNFKPFMESGITVVFTDHTRKPHPNEGGLIPKKEQLLGSQDKFAAVEAVIMLRMKPGTKTESGSTATINVYPMKNKGGPEAKPFQIDIIHADDPDGGGTTTLTYAAEIEDRVMQAEVTEDAIMDYLAGQTEKRATTEIIESLKGKAGKTAIEAKLRELREVKKVGFEKAGQKYLYWSLGEGDANGDDLPPLYEEAS